MDLPTYTNIWRIEKRLYKLYDLRLPMPLPLVQIGVFIGVFVPWILLLRLVGIPFKSPWHVLYLVPPGVLTWLATRPVIEGKRLTELLLSQARYLAEPRTWCRLTPIREPGEVVVVARVWRQADGTALAAAAPERAAIRADRKAREAERGRRSRPARRAAAPAQAAAAAYTAQAALAATRPAPAPGSERAPAPSLPAVPGRPAGPVQRVPADARPAVRQWRAPAARDIAHESPASRDPMAPQRALALPPPTVLPEPAVPPVAPPAAPPAVPAADLERPPATPALEMPPALERRTESQDRTQEAGQSQGQGQGQAETQAQGQGAGQGSGKRAFASGVLRPGAAAEFWQAVPPGAAGTEDASAAEEAAQREIPSVPGAFGAAGRANGAIDDGDRVEPATATETAPALTEAATATDRPDAAGTESAPAAADDPAAETPAPDTAAAESEAAEAPAVGAEARPEPIKQPVVEPVREPVREPVVKPPPKPWSQELSRPRSSGDDALVWPPAGRPGALPPRPRQAKAVKPAPPPVVPEPRAPAPGPRSPVPEPLGHEETEAPPPAREVRSGPASPVRPRPLPQPAPPPPPGPAITPPDPEHEPPPGGLRRLLKAVGGGHGDVDSEWEERLQRPFQGTRHIVVLGCTGGAGQTVTALMLGHSFAHHGGEPIVAIDVNPGPGALARRSRSETNETLTGLITRADQISSLTAMRRYTSRAKSGLDVIAAGKNPLHALDDRDYALAIRTIDRFYSVTLLDAAAAVVARVLPHADQLVLVAPASADAPRAVAMTFEWLDGHGYDELRSRAVTVINGVSRRSMDDVEQAEAVARGRCRALVRIPWDDHLSLDRSPRNELKSLRAPTRRAYLALAGVVAGGFVEVPERYLDQEQEASR